MESIKIFNKGLNSDLSPVYQQDDTYTDALNIELVNDELKGSIAVSNSKGNKFQIAIPDIQPVIKVTFIEAGVTNIVIEGESGTGFIMNSIKDLYDYITTSPSYSYLNNRYKIAYSDLNLIIYPLTNNPIDVIALGGLIVNPIFIPAQENLQVIGYGIIRDDIYLFTTANTSLDPKTTGDGYGYIFKLTYDIISLDTNLAKLDIIYAGNLNFSTYWNIPQTGVVGRYENDLIQRLYWTDNYNKLRSINVIDPQVLATDINLIDVQPSTSLDIPILTNIRSAPGTEEIPIGCYQLAYRLLNLGGASTVYSVPSNPVFVVPYPEEDQNSSVNWSTYHGEILGTKTTKRITWKINTLDRNYSRIEAIILFRETKTSIPTITSFYEGPINSNSLEIDMDGNLLNSSNSFNITIDEFNLLSAIFTHAKTIASKDNRLVVGNIRNETNSIDEYDARAYRFNSIGNFQIIENSTLSIPYTPVDFFIISENSDAINPFNLIDTNPLYNADMKYKSDGSTLGGEGRNISYEFVSVGVLSDTSSELTDPQPLPLYKTDPLTPEIKLGVDYNDSNGNNIEQIYTNRFPNIINDGMKYPQYNSVLWGYQHNEIYRFGIQFFDKQKNPYFVKWIGDIKFPDYFDPCPANNNITTYLNSFTGLTDYRTSYAVTDDCYTFQLGIKFNIKIPASLLPKISGYSIVRVKREEKDKTVVAEGIVSNLMLNVAPSSYMLQAVDMPYNGANTNRNRLQFITPNILDSSLIQPSLGMSLRISSYLTAKNAVQNVYIVGGTTDLQKNQIYKLYNHVSTTAYKANILYSKLMEVNGYTSYLTDNFNNYAPSGIYTNNGNPAYLFVIDGPGLPNTIVGAGSSKYMAYIYNPIINQYGGNTYTSRSNNEYILCSHFRPIINELIDINDDFMLFGGDVTNDIMDEERVSKRYINAATDRYSTTFLYPSSSPVNRNLRHGRHPNISLFDTITIDNERTDYFYNKVYSSENDIVKFNPKPSNFKQVSNYDNRFYISEIKINGELTDSWSIFKANDYWDVEGIYGPINSMLSFKDKMYFWQSNAFGIIEINPRVLINDAGSSTNSQISTGTGLPLQRHDYISNKVGTKHQGSTIASDNKIYWFDVNTKKIYNFTGGVEPFSDVNGLYSYLNKNIQGFILTEDKPTHYLTRNIFEGVNGVVATFDYKRHKAIFTFHSGIPNANNTTSIQKSFTLCINELLNCFTTFYSFIPRIYINDSKYIFSTTGVGSNTQLNRIFVHDVGDYSNYYNVINPTYLRFIVNNNPQYTKVFDNFKYDSQARIFDSISNQYINQNDITWNTCRITNDYQNTDIQNISDICERKERTWLGYIPRNRVLYSTSNSPNIYTDLSFGNKSFGERIRDKYIQVELRYFNVENVELITNNFSTTFRQSAR